MSEKTRLVLTMRDGDEVQIGDDVCLKFIKVINGQMRIMFNAPKSVRITRLNTWSHEENRKLNEDEKATYNEDRRAFLLDYRAKKASKEK